MHASWQSAADIVSTDHISVLVAGIALAVSVWTGLIARRNARAAAAQALATQTQAEAAIEQSAEANAAVREAKRSSNAAELAILNAVRTSIDERSPRLAVAIEEVPWPPILTNWLANHNTNEAPSPIPPAMKRIDYWHWRLQFVVRGVIYNDGNQSLRVYPEEHIFIDGTTPLWHESLTRPVVCDPFKPEYWLLPGQAALFEWRPYHVLREWFSIHKGESNARPLELQFFVRHGSFEGKLSGHILRFSADPVQLVKESEDIRNEVWAIADNAAIGNVLVEFRSHRKYPKDFQSLLRNPNGITMSDDYYYLFGVEAELPDL